MGTLAATRLMPRCGVECIDMPKPHHRAMCARLGAQVVLQTALRADLSGSLGRIDETRARRPGYGAG